MKKEFTASWYDERYKVGGHKKEYFKTPEECIYHKLWLNVLKLVTKDDKILEIGCGAGQLAKMLIYGGFKYVKGFDFSKEAIKLCKANLPSEYHDKFIIGNVYEEDVYQEDFNTVICCEVFEHLDDDVEVLSNIKKNSKIIFTVPNFDSKSHVRFFKTREEIKERYQDVVKIVSISEIFVGITNKIYLINCVRK